LGAGAIDKSIPPTPCNYCKRIVRALRLQVDPGADPAI